MPAVSVMSRSELRHYRRVCDPLATFANLRNAGVLGDYSYLHLSPDHTEIGWAPVEHLRLLAGLPCDDWREQLLRFSLRAEQLERKAFGYIGFDAVDSHVGTLPDRSQTGRPLVEFVIPGETITFAGYEVMHRGLGGVDLQRYLADKKPTSPRAGASPLVPVNGTPEHAYVEAVRQAVAALQAGEAKKVVLARYQAYDADFDPVTLFASLVPPFVDAFLICFGDLVAVVPSPELLLRGKNRHIETNTLAGTRPRGPSPAEDQRLRTELMENHKEIVEHVVSVNTVLAELDPICAKNSLVVSRFMEVALQPKVQHLSSVIRGSLAPGHQILDALWALFPAVTVTGLPKTTATKFIRSLEPSPRYLYAGAMGWLSGIGDCRFSLALRGLFRCGDRSFLQAGAGILAESVPEAELQETCYKLSAMKDALALALGSGNRNEPAGRLAASGADAPADHCPPVTSIV